MLHHGSGNYFSTVILYQHYFNYQVLEQEDLTQFTYPEAICNVDKVDEWKMQGKLQQFQKCVVMVQLLRIFLLSCCFSPSMVPVFELLGVMMCQAVLLNMGCSSSLVLSSFGNLICDCN